MGVSRDYSPKKGGIGIITNPHSRVNKKNPRRPKLLSYIAGSQVFFECTATLSALETTLKNFKDEGVSVIAINGGDGTISRTITSMMRVWKNSDLPAISVLRGGTMNVIADNLGLYGSPEKLLASLIHAHGSYQLDELSCLKIGDNYGFLFGAGMVPRFLKEFYKNKGGHLKAVSLVSRISFSLLLGISSPLFETNVVEIEFEDKTKLRTPSLALLCSTVRNLPMKLPFFGHLGRQEEVFECTNLSMSGGTLLKKIPKIIWQKDNLEETLRFLGKKITISQNSPLDYTIDGELFKTEAPLCIEVGPSLRFVRGLL